MLKLEKVPSVLSAGSASGALASGRRVIAAEAEALWTLEQSLDASFEQAVALIHGTRGRLVLCALGKSGLIARKVAATLIATGTSACFLHAGEAAHGDLGMLERGDTLAIVSNSGETKEFAAVIACAQRLCVPILAITGAARSRVARAAEVVIVLPYRPEACPWGSTPTTSTTMTLALGDAIAVALMELRHTQAADLHRVHPGGKLGFDLEPVSSIMHTGEALPLVAADLRMAEVLEAVRGGNFGLAGVVTPDRRLLGIITDGDIRRHAFALEGSAAKDVMTVRPRTLLATACVRDALVSMSGARITSLFVLDDVDARRVVGLVHIHDLLRGRVL